MCYTRVIRLHTKHCEVNYFHIRAQYKVWSSLNLKKKKKEFDNKYSI